MSSAFKAMGVGGALVVALFLVASGAAVGADVLPSARSRFEERELPRPAGVPDDAELKASGAVIGEIRQVRLNVFDTTISEEDTSLFRLANRLHIVSRESTVGAQLLFAPGDRYDVRLLQESERILRAHPYLRDARIRPVAYHDGVVDIEINTQDTWTLKPEVSFGRQGGRNRSGFGIEEKNLLGFGTEMALKFKSGIDRDTKTLLYSDPHLLGSKWRLDTLYSSNSDGKAQEFTFERPFFALDSRWSAGVSFRNEGRIDSVYDNGRIVDQFRTHERVETVYGGWSAGLRDGWATRWTAGVTYDERHAKPLETATTIGPLPADRKLVYPWVGVEMVEDDFRETRNLDQIGRTEDLALGWHVTLRLGAATPGFGSDRKAAVFDLGVSNGFQPGDQHTLIFTGTASGRIESGAPVDALFGATARYYWRQWAQRTFFMGLSADRGSHLDIDKQLTLGGDNGLRGYPFRYRTGQGRWIFTAEQRAYTEWYPFRLFNVGGAAFFDMGRTWGKSAVASQPLPPPVAGVLKDVGVGLRLGNNRSALGSVVHIDLAFPIDADASVRKFQLNIEAKHGF